jgi:hypothetical protein
MVGGLCLLLPACGSGKVKKDDPSVTPVGKYKELLVGKWEADEKDAFIQGYEFASDNTLKMTVKGMKEPIPGKFSWSGDRELDIKYNPSPEVKKDYAAAAKAYKEPGQKRLAEGKLSGQIAAGVKKGLAAIPDEAPATETAKVILAETPVPVLIVTVKDRVINFHRAKQEGERRGTKG